MESKLLYDFYISKWIGKDEVINFIRKKDLSDTGNFAYYDILYSEGISNKKFLISLKSICYSSFFKDEIKNKYKMIITFFNQKKENVNIEESLYYFYLDKEKELLGIDFEFWNLVSTDWELKRDGFDGINGSLNLIYDYLTNHSYKYELPDDEITNILFTI